MPWISANIIALSSYAFLYLSVALLWVQGKQKIPVWIFSLIVSILLGLVSHQIELTTITPIILFAVSVYCSQPGKRNATIRLIAVSCTLILGYGFLKHLFPGFHHLTILDHVYMSKDAVPFSLNLNFDKTLVGVLILGVSGKLISKKKEWVELLKTLSWRTPAVILFVMILSFRYHFATLDIKFPHSILIWSIVNLLCVSVAEEAYYRGFIQKHLATFMSNVKHGEFVAIVVAACFFGLDHYAGGLSYVALAGAAGMGYGWVYYMTKRIEGSILTHFALNLVHFIFFTYPALAVMN